MLSMAKSASKQRALDCVDAGGRAENFRIGGVHEDSSADLTPREWHKDVPYTNLRMESRKKTIKRGALK